jgi:hypothetical protein
MRLFSTAGTSGKAPTMDIQVWDPKTSSYITVTGIVIDDNPGTLSLKDWFENNIDINGTLLNSGAVEEQRLSNDQTAFITSGAIPSQYLDQAGPPALAYLMSPSRSQVLIFTLPQDSALADIGFSPQSLEASIPTILGSVAFQ